MVKCVKVDKRDAEMLLREIKVCGLLDCKHRIERDENFVYIPLKDAPEELTVLHQKHGEIEFVERNMTRSAERPRHYSESLSLPQEIMKQLPSSFDIVGDIAIIKLPEKLKKHAKEIGDAMLRTYSSVKTVLVDEGVDGDYRIRKVSYAAGEEKTRTLHIEYGLRFEVDLAKVYFSPRLANDRQRICSEIVSPCVVIDMFAGVGPFSVAIAKKHPEARVYAIDINPDAHVLLLKNIVRNRVKNVEAICGDAVVEIQKLPDADYIVMNLPHTAEKFLFLALKKLKRNGKIFLYTICKRDEIRTKVEEIKNKIAETGRKSMVEFHEVHTYSPTSSVFCLIICT
ncbi:MAG: class I SAM-dependent methyltransferase family protein [Thermoplasmata archaeon]|nr:class I SAM-dependent methyltransferase family protein [Thermoplasmata archaeon]